MGIIGYRRQLIARSNRTQNGKGTMRAEYETEQLVKSKTNGSEPVRVVLSLVVKYDVAKASPTN